MTAMWSAWEETGRIGSRKLCIEILRFNRTGLVRTISTSYSDIGDKTCGSVGFVRLGGVSEEILVLVIKMMRGARV